MKPITENELLYQHDIKIKELVTRLNSLENLVNEMHNKYPVWWDEQ